MMKIAYLVSMSIQNLKKFSNLKFKILIIQLVQLFNLMRYKKCWIEIEVRLVLIG